MERDLTHSQLLWRKRIRSNKQREEEVSGWVCHWVQWWHWNSMTAGTTFCALDIIFLSVFSTILFYSTCSSI